MNQDAEYTEIRKTVQINEVRSYAEENSISLLQAEVSLLKQGVVPSRYIGNVRLFGIEGQIKLLEAKVCIVGCGGLGSFSCEFCARLGIGSLVLADPDVFEEANLNRQLLCTEENIGKAKAVAAKERIAKINYSVMVEANVLKVDGDNFEMLIDGCSVCLDAVDNIETRLILEKACIGKNIPLVHGAIGDAGFQVAVVHDRQILSSIYQDTKTSVSFGNPVPTVAACAARQVGEAVKLITEQGEPLESRMLIENWMVNSSDMFEL